MYHIMVIYMFIGVIYAGIQMPYSENHKIQQLSTGPVYSPPQNNNPSLVPYHYPTYPEYTKTEYAGQSGSGNFPTAITVPHQKHSQWSPGQIVSSLVLLSNNLIIYGARVGIYMLHFVLILLLGSAFTTLICTFTPICSITFLGLGINKNQIKEQVAELARMYITPENLNAATILVTRAIDKYATLQYEKDKNDEQHTKQEEKLENAKTQ